MQWVPVLVIGLTLLSVSFDGKAQQHATSAKEKEESYDIYSTVLKIKGPNVAKWTIVRETRGFEMCLKPARDQESIYQLIIDDYALNNKTTAVLQRKFKLPSYALTGPEAFDFGNRTVAVFSAVGFSRDRTRAMACFWANDSGTCEVMVKQEDKWQIDRVWRGSGCGWAY
jgi:hypothetical protein